MLYQHYKFEAPENDCKKVERLEIQPLYLTHASYNESWHSILHAHPFTEIFFIFNGQGKFNLNGTVFSVKANDLIIINPNQMHTEFNDGDNPLEYMVLGINNLSFQTEPTDSGVKNLFHFAAYRNEIKFCLEMLLRELRTKKENSNLICADFLEALLLLIMRSTNTAFQTASTSKASRECLFIEQYINEHFSEEITLDILSQLTYMDKYYLVHIFKKHTGVSPIRYLINRRITEAKYLLETTNFSAAKIAQYIGFSSQSYFSQAFCREMGMTPSQYRKTFDRRQA